MEHLVLVAVTNDMNITPPKSARKRILFAGSPADESGDDTLGHMSPLSSSSPDRYSSPPPSPQWLLETPPGKCVASQSPIGPVQRKRDIPKSSVQKLPLNRIQNSQGQDRGEITNPELVEESPMKDSLKMGLITPFKCLASKDKQNEETPKQKLQRLVIEESPDIFSAAAPVKALQKPKPDYNASTVLKPLHTFTGANKLSSLPTSSFYHSSRARAALFPEHSSASSNTLSSVTGSKKRKRKPSAESHSHISLCLSRSRKQLAKRRKIGEINAGVYHRIKKHIKKKFTCKHTVDNAQPKIMPEDRILSYLDKAEQSITDTKDSVHDEKYINFTPSHNVQPHLLDNTLKTSGGALTSHRMEPICPASPPPDPTKKFFKTQRTLKINTSATVTVDKNIKLKVSNGKFSLSKRETKSKFCRFNKAGVSESSQNKKNGIFAENGIAEVMQETVRDSVETLLKNLEESPKKDNLLAAGDMQSPDHYISSITTSTSSLAIHDDPLPQFVPQTSQSLSCPSDGHSVETRTEKNQKEFLFVDLQDGENTTEDNGAKENQNKYFPVFYKSSADKTLADLTNVTKRAKKRLWKSIGDNQYVIDAGQKKFGATQCKECGIVYQIGDPEDEMSHKKYHDNALTLKLTPWKQERVVAYYGTDRVILIKPNDPKSWLNKAKNVLNMVDTELGYVDAELGNFNKSQTYLYVMGKQVTGCVVAHSITFAYKMLNSVIEGCDCCSEESYPAKCGVSRVWVEKNYRRKKIASRLMDCVRSSFIHGYIIGMDEFAFSAPTIAGKAFAEKYTGTVNYLVYT